ncbi:MAG TPA: ABC transporter substrate-binding protein [Gemmatimonadaceae bacterium]|nr:ABC transporter substrate-binding protein [Gemmatimonadaceae bacterium]
MPPYCRTGLPVLALLLASCATGARRPPLAPEPAAECIVAAEGAKDSSAPTTSAITIAVTTPLDTANAPWPRNAGERLLFAQLYEPLVRLDCTGALIPALAQSWRRESRASESTDDSAKTGGAATTRESTASRDDSPAPRVVRLTFTLRHGARFTNGDQVRASDVISSWRASAEAHAREPVGSLISAIASGARATDDSTLVVELPDSLADLRALASPYLAVSRPAPSGSGWPYGTTSYYVDSALERYGPAPGERLPVMAIVGLRALGKVTPKSAATGGSSTSGKAPPLLFQVVPDADRRDILDWGADILITSSPAAVQYARTQIDRASIPLPWTRIYVLLLPAHDASGDAARCADSALRPLRDALAMAVHIEARGAEGPCWWRSGSSGARRDPHLHTRPRQILYSMEDATARELAERIVALASPGREEPATTALRHAAPELFEGGDWNAAGMDSIHFAARLKRGTDGAYILALPSDPEWPAAARAALRAAAPWLAPFGGTGAILPLVDARETLLIRRERGIPRMTILHDATVIFDAAASANSGNAGDTSASGRSTP